MHVPVRRPALRSMVLACLLGASIAAAAYQFGASRHQAPARTTGDSTPVATARMTDEDVVMHAPACDETPDFTSTQTETERYASCLQAADVEAMLAASGADASNVEVTRVPTGAFLGPEKVIRVRAQVFLPDTLESSWNARQAAKAISRTIGTDIGDVVLVDDHMQPLFDGRADRRPTKRTARTH